MEKSDPPTSARLSRSCHEKQLPSALPTMPSAHRSRVTSAYAVAPSVASLANCCSSAISRSNATRQQRALFLQRRELPFLVEVPVENFAPRGMLQSGVADPPLQIFNVTGAGGLVIDEPRRREVPLCPLQGQPRNVQFQPQGMCLCRIFTFQQRDGIVTSTLLTRCWSLLTRSDQPSPMPPLSRTRNDSRLI
jgi:hypothetical protein